MNSGSVPKTFVKKPVEWSTDKILFLFTRKRIRSIKAKTIQKIAEIPGYFFFLFLSDMERSIKQENIFVQTI